MARKTQSSGGKGDRLDAMLLCALLALCAAVLAGLSWTRPVRVPAGTPYVQSGRMSYAGAVNAASVYGSAGLKTGEPVYFDQVSALRVTYAYRFESAAPSSLKGTEQLVAKVENGQGVTRSIPLQPITHFEGGSFSTIGTLPTSSLQAIVTAFSGITSGGEATYRVTITPAIHVRGTLGSTVVATTFDPVATFNLQSSILIPGTSAATTAKAPGTVPSVMRQFHSTADGSAPISGGHRATFLGVPVWDVRIGALVILAGGLVGVTLLGLPLFWEATSEDERVRIGRRYGSSLVDVEALPESPGLMAVDLSSFDGLRQVARRLECPILHRGGGSDVYAVVDNGTLYRYQHPQRTKSTRTSNGNRQAASASHTVTVTTSGGRPS